MPEGSSWRNAANYEYLQHLAPAELAWEFLRRNPDYERDYSRASRKADAATVDALTARWGLRFPDKPDAARCRSGGLLDPCDRSRDTHSRPAAGNPRSCRIKFQL